MFIQVIQGRCSRQDEMQAAMAEWEAERGPEVVGWLGGTYGFTDDGLCVAVVRFESEEAARANSDSREQSAWWDRTSQLFDGPIEFHDCTDVTMMMDGGSDDAGFVQIIQGRVLDADALRAMSTDTDSLHRMRPEIIGGTLAIDADGTFTETVAFTDEAAARQGESTEMPDEVREQFEQAMADVRYLDLHHPLFMSRT
ncbi:hypothetical protein CLV56_0390 [Mumia flava]|uniref:Antibiotic biosynthesis monooxygenase n=1 Tax=Mumia flava TaxID=1348852 RepID=A0A0B2BLX1_9ACTN|nr:hypothetical protein [Mumia flava]PJJ56186.1 hypothetical protein CLV56_0390 [Mumia flava]